MIFTVGLTGGIASGKSYVGALFAGLGVPLLDADQASRAVVEPGSPVLGAIAARFGNQMLLEGGALNRAGLRALVFADTAARRDLEALTHPAIGAYISQWRRSQSAAYCILENAIMIESGMYKTVDRVLLVDAPVERQKARLLARDHLDETGVERMLKAQASRLQRMAHAHDVIDNAVETASLGAVVHRLNQVYIALAASAKTRVPATIR